MQSIRLLAAAAALAGVALSQVNPFLFYPQDPERQTITCTSFVGRPDMSQRAEALMELSTQHFRGIGDANGMIRLFGVFHWVADEKMSTVEAYDLVVRNGAATAGPDMSPTGELLRITGLSTPPSTNPLRGTWIMYDGFSIAGGLVILPTNMQTLAPDRYYVGVDLPANPLWPATDGHSLFRADLLNAGTGSVFGENHRAGAPDPTWAGRLTAPSFSTPWTYILGPFVTSPNLHIGGIDPTSNRLGAPGANLSMNGLFPDIGGLPRRDGLMIRVTDSLAPSAMTFLGASVGFEPAFFVWQLQNVLIGHSFIGNGGSQTLPVAFAPLSLGVREFPIASPNTLSPSLLGTSFAFQALVWDIGTNVAEWTNAQEVHL